MARTSLALNACLGIEGRVAETFGFELFFVFEFAFYVDFRDPLDLLFFSS